MLALTAHPRSALSAAASLLGGGESEVFFDADNSYFSRDAALQTFAGDVVAIAAGTLVAADQITLNRSNDTLTAKGHVFVLSTNQVFTGEMLTYHLPTGEFTLTAAAMLANDGKTSREIIHKTLGLSFEELQFEAARSERLQEIAAHKQLLRQQYRAQVTAPLANRRELIERYTILLEKEEMIRRQEPPSLTRLNPEKKQAYQRRREAWEKSQRAGLAYSLEGIGYFAVIGADITRIDATQFRAKDAFVTPCLCESDEAPAWGFYSSEIVARAGGYADLENPVLMIKGIPVLYLPYLRVPLKTQRQSGFLLPNISYTSSNGNIVSQPLYLAFDRASDATITTDVIQKRGVRLGAEYRLQTGEYSGWEVHAEAIRDRLWLLDRDNRSRLINNYSLGLQQARRQYATAGVGTAGAGSGGGASDPTQLSSPAWWQAAKLGNCLDSDELMGSCLTYDIKNRLETPENSWRGKVNWQGQTILAPRLTLVSSGVMLSDHRYLDDLYVPSFASPISNSMPPLFAEAKYRLHYDGANGYAGIGGAYGDHALTAQRYEGYQQPFTLKLQSRLLPLSRMLTPFLIYGQVSYDQRLISLYRPPQLNSTLPEGVRLQSLGGGRWHRGQIALMTPLVVDQVFQTSHFTEFDYRQVSTGPLETYQQGERTLLSPVWKDQSHSNRNHLHSLHTGLRFSLPLEGRMALPSLPGKDGDPTPLERQLQHQMNWEMTLSLRPYVARRGDYGEVYQLQKYNPATQTWNPPPGTQRLTYFASDSSAYGDTDIIAEEHLMVPHQKIIFKTSHDWAIATRKWQLQPGHTPAPLPEAEEESPREKAKRELFSSLDHPITSATDMYDDSSGQWLVNRYFLQEAGREEPLHVDAEINYDYVKEKLRLQQKQKTQGASLGTLLPEPWSPLRSRAGVNWQSWTLGVDSQYNFYQHLATDLNFSLLPPSLFATTLGLYYRIEKESTPLAQGGFLTAQTHTRSYTLSSTLLPHTVMALQYGIRTRYERTPSDEIMAAASVKYLSSSNCWGLKFAWEKPFIDTSWHGTYFLALVIKFINYERDIGNLTSRINTPET